MKGLLVLISCAEKSIPEVPKDGNIEGKGSLKKNAFYPFNDTPLDNVTDECIAVPTWNENKAEETNEKIYSQVETSTFGSIEYVFDLPVENDLLRLLDEDESFLNDGNLEGLVFQELQGFFSNNITDVAMDEGFFDNLLESSVSTKKQSQ